MHKIVSKTSLLIVTLTVGSLANAGGRGPAVTPPPTITKAAVDTKENVLIISGRNFGATTPTVMLAEQVLGVKRFSEHEVVTSLPRDFAFATYGITITTSGARHHATSNLFSIALPSSGDR